MEQETKRKRRRKAGGKMSRQAKAILAVIIAVIVLAGAGTGIWFYLDSKNVTAAETPREDADPDAAQEDYEAMQAQVVMDNDDPMHRQVDFEALQEVNPDVYAWIWIPGTNIDYPVLQSATKADDYYLNTTIDGKQGYPGAIYTEKYNSTSFADTVTIMYGHNMKNGTMFTALHKYVDKEFFDEHPYIYIYHPDYTLKYQIFAAVAFDDRYILGEYNFQDPDDFQKYLDELRSSIDGNVNQEIQVAQDTTILTLSTCISEYPDQRWLVNGTIIDAVAEMEQ